MEAKVSNLLGTFGFIIIFLFAYQIAAVWRATGRFPVPVLRQGNHFWRILSLGVFAYPLLILTFAMFPKLFTPFAPFAALDSFVCKLFGALMLAIGTAVIMVSYATIGTSWRVGIDKESPGDLVQRGIYSRIRHPIYTGVILYSSGIFLVAPNALFLFGALLHLFGAFWVSAKEEVFLEERFGESFRSYRARTGRFFPCLPPAD